MAYFFNFFNRFYGDCTIFKSTILCEGFFDAYWLPGIEGLLRRLDEIPREKVREALKELGDPNSDNYWQKIDGAYYHQLPDLLLAWDFAYDLTIEPGEYEEAEE